MFRPTLKLPAELIHDRRSVAQKNCLEARDLYICLRTVHRSTSLRYDSIEYQRSAVQRLNVRPPFEQKRHPPSTTDTRTIATQYWNRGRTTGSQYWNRGRMTGSQSQLPTTRVRLSTFEMLSPRFVQRQLFPNVDDIRGCGQWRKKCCWNSKEEASDITRKCFTHISWRSGQ